MTLKSLFIPLLGFLFLLSISQVAWALDDNYSLSSRQNSFLADTTDYFISKNSLHEQFRYELIQTNSSPIRLDDVDKYIADAPVFFGNEYNDLPIVTLLSLVQATVDVYKAQGVTLNIYNYDTNFYHPVNKDYIVLVSDSDKHGFMVIRPSNEDGLAREETPLFSFICKIEVYELQGVFCSEPEIKINGKKQSINNAIKSNSIIQRALKDSENGNWNQAG
ncbi:MAG: hypothetical protein LBJ61_00230 [Deltaproteobacteria bacterium]|jgi:hypothetical protein|nr:hypothetical protein [Deltaproteobacteria bacterium]